jgi:ribosome maturation factor RimP
MEALKNKLGALLPEDLVLMDVIEDHYRPGVKLVVDGSKPISIQATADVARAVRDSGILDGIFPDGYQLEVTSPGLEAPLTHPFQYKKNMGRKVELTLKDQGAPQVVKILTVDETGFTGKDQRGVEGRYPFEAIETAKIVIEFN